MMKRCQSFPIRSWVDLPHVCEYLSLDGIPFPGLPKLLLSATHLVNLHLYDIPHSGYISPEAMVTALSTLTSLESLSLEFQSPRSRPDRASRRPPPPTRSVLPVLTCFSFKGVSEYLDDLVARIDAPRLNNLSITFFNEIVFDTPQFIQFISRTPTLKALEKARVAFEDDAAKVKLSSQTSGYGELNVKISCRELDWQVSSLEQVCTSCLPPLSTLEDLYIYEDPYSRPTLARQHREHAMAGTITPIYRCEESLPIRGICATYRACPARARWGQNDRSVAHPAEYFLGGAPAIGTCPGRHWSSSLPRDRSPVTL